MHIKSLTIRGFKTYRQETVISDLSAHANMFLGKNGSGKSNLLDAVQFVLSDKYSSLREEERRKLLHEGAGRDTTVADVEIVFDNSDKRIPLEPPKGDRDNTDVRVRRTIGGKKDQILVNGAPYTQADFQALLESTGMSRSNPYYIVEQGKIAQLMKQSKAQRLALFKEIAGTRTYDERRKESLKIMRDTDQKRHTIDTVIDVLQNKLKDLETETEQFKKYEVLDTTRRSLEYSIYEREREMASAKLDEIDKKRAGGSSHAEKEGAAYAAAHQAVQDAEDEMDTLRNSIAKAQASKRSLGGAYNEQVARRTELQLSIKDLSDRLAGIQGGKADAATQLKQLQKKIKETKAKLESVTSELSGVLAEEEKLETSFQTADQRLQDVCGKRERSSKYANKKERDAELKKTISKVKKQRDETQRQIDRLTGEMNEAQAAADKLEADMSQKEEQMEANRKSVEKVNEQLEKLAKIRDASNDTRKETWKREAERESEMAELKATLDKAQRSLQITMDKDLFRGVEAVRQIAIDLKLPGVFGPLIELFTCKAEFHQAVEITAGNSLFHVVVDSDATASTVIHELNRRKAGRVTFVPLNRIEPKRPDYPASPDAMPMIKQLQFEPKFEKAFMQVFGKTLIARDLNVAAQLSLDHNLDTITLAGDRVDKKGALTGGYSDFGGRSRLQAQADIAATQDRFADLQKEIVAIKNELRKNETDVQRSVSEITKLNEQKANLRSQNTQLTQDISQGKREHKTLLDTVARNERALPGLRASLASSETQLTSLESELASAFSSGLDAGEEAELKALTLEVDGLKTELVKLRTKKADVEARKAELDSLLFNNLLRKEEELNGKLNAATQEDERETLQRDETELGALNAIIKDVESQLKKADAEIEQATTRIRTLDKELDTLRSAESAAAAHLSDDAKSMDKLLSQRSLYVSKRDDCMKKIRELGALPNEAFDKYKGLDIKKLMKLLEKTNADLKKMSGVNKKAFDQYSTYMEEKDELLKRKEELDAGRSSIEELISHLDMKKDDAIMRTYKTIAAHFSAVFSELVPGGKATLVIESSANEETLNGEGGEEEGEEGEEEEEEEEEERKTSSRRPKKKAKHVEEKAGPQTFTGIGIKVAFTGVSSATHQLSGGQESVLALSLIFAIQRCDPSPFYLLDEIDSALDPVHRTAVANMLAKQSAEAQFLCTTFHPEMLSAADKFFGVVFKNKASFVSVITEDQAHELIRVVEREAEQ